MKEETLHETPQKYNRSQDITTNNYIQANKKSLSK